MPEQSMPGPYYTFESLEAESSVGYLIKRCGILMTQLAEQRFESQPVSFTQWIILIQLAQRTQLTPTEISTHLGYDMGALTRIVDDLEQKKLVHRSRNEQDRRAVQITLTPAGRGLAFDAKAAVVELINELVEPYTKAETDKLISMLQRLLLHMEDVAGRLPGKASKDGTISPATRRAPARSSRAGPRRAPRGPR
jgi:DNA-binding MarR family transcriptional regulator